MRPLLLALVLLPFAAQAHDDHDHDHAHGSLGKHEPVSYTHLRAHETGRNLVCRLLLEKKKKKN